MKIKTRSTILAMIATFIGSIAVSRYYTVQGLSWWYLPFFIGSVVLLFSPAYSWWQDVFTRYFERRAFYKKVRRFDQIVDAQMNTTEGDEAEAKLLARQILDYEEKNFPIGAKKKLK